MAGIIPAAGSGSSGGRFRRRRYTPIADINVTPLVDVMLVLLIIFMVTAPLLQVGVPVDLPKTSASQVGGTEAAKLHARAAAIEADLATTAGGVKQPADEPAAEAGEERQAA